MPTVEVRVDELGPSSVTELVEVSDVIVEAELVAVDAGARFYSSGDEDPDPRWFEDVLARFEVTEGLKGKTPDDVSVAWPAYTRTAGSENAERVETIEYEGLVLTEASVGTSYLLFLHRLSGSDELDLVNLSDSIQPLTPDGRLAGRDHASLFAGEVGSDVAEVVVAS